MKRFHISKTRAAVACAVTAAMLILTALAEKGEGADMTCRTIALLLAAGAGIFCLCPLKFGRALSFVMAVVLPFFALCALERYTNAPPEGTSLLLRLTGFYPQTLTPQIFFLNLLFFWLLYGTLIFVCGSVRIGGILATLVPMLFGLVNYFVVQFRSHPIVPWDFLSIRTALSVTDSYTFTFIWRIVFVLFAFLWIILLFSKSEVRFQKPGLRIPAAAAFILLTAGYIAGIQRSDVQDYFGMDKTLFTLNVLYRNNGVAAAFLGNLRFLNIEEPEGYSPEKVAEIQKKTGTSQEEPDAGLSEYPNIIVIMNEAFSDLSVYGDFETSEEVMPFVKKLQRESVGGEVYVSVKGGNTANTEFEFLTGNTMAFLPAGSVPYQQYINEPLPNLASRLKKLGYRTLAIHPYNASGWDRDEVYGYFGFDQFLSLSSFVNPQKYRGYVSDQAAFDKIIEQYQKKDPQERLFVFEVTMQNHGGYSRETPDFTIYLTLPEVEPKTLSVTSTEKYLTLMNLSDRALENLVSYFEEQDEPTVILMLGDHQPSDYITNVARRITGTDSDPAYDERQTGYRVPFVIWSSRGLEHRYFDGISVNYLGGVLMEAAGIPLTGYQEFLSKLMEELPVVNANGFRDAAGTFFSYSQDEDSELLDEYRILQYNDLMDSGHRDDAFYD